MNKHFLFSREYGKIKRSKVHKIRVISSIFKKEKGFQINKKLYSIPASDFQGLWILLNATFCVLIWTKKEVIFRIHLKIAIKARCELLHWFPFASFVLISTASLSNLTFLGELIWTNISNCCYKLFVKTWWHFLFVLWL